MDVLFSPVLPVFMDVLLSGYQALSLAGYNAEYGFDALSLSLVESIAQGCGVNEPKPLQHKYRWQLMFSR
ncbi:hypothetical protein [Endozoicomonas sp.]|uniref:hypothetical protein n=1 Tax=Endozoicomonas sp. TaxID=1892382 RepID=UPI00383A240F